MPICSACVGSRQWALIAPVEVTNEKICMYRKKEQKPGAEDPRARKKSTMVLFYKRGMRVWQAIGAPSLCRVQFMLHC